MSESFRANRNYKKHGYMHGLDVSKPKESMHIFCIRRSTDVFRDFEASLHTKDLIARVYCQGLIDGMNMFNQPPEGEKE